MGLQAKPPYWALPQLKPRDHQNPMALQGHLVFLLQFLPLVLTYWVETQLELSIRDQNRN